MTLPEIDGTEIQRIIVEARSRYESGTMDRETWLRLNREFVGAARGQLGMPGILGKSGKPEWFEELQSSPQKVA
jgi:hypothetical protein